jgi:DNA-directed RNA polymerase specialized sigma24 family protein
MNTVKVTASQWAHGWELFFDDGDDDGVTQTRTLAGAEQQVRDYLDSMHPEINHADWLIEVVPQLGSVLAEVHVAKAASVAAQQALASAAQQMRTAVKGLRAKGLSLADTATVLGVTKTRAQQLVA